MWLQRVVLIIVGAVSKIDTNLAPGCLLIRAVNVSDDAVLFCTAPVNCYAVPNRNCLALVVDKCGLVV